MAGKTDTRQKMINMMYLVFIAMLALNISKEVLATLGILNNDLEYSIQELEASAEASLTIINNNSDKPNYESADFILNIRSISNDFYDHIENIKDSLMSSNENNYLKEVAVKNRDSVITITDYQIMDKSQPLDKYFFIGDGYTTSGNLFLDKYINYSIEINKNLDNIIEKEISLSKEFPLNFDFSYIKNNISNRFKYSEKVITSDGTEEDFLKYNYEGFPLIASISKLTKIQSDIRYIEDYIYSEVLFAINGDNFSGNSLLLEGRPSYYTTDFVDASIVVGKKDPAYVFDEIELSINDRKLIPSEYKQERGRIILNKRIFTPGQYSLSGFVAKKDPVTQKLDSIFLDQKINIVKEPNSAVVSADNMRVFYRKLQNPTSISIPGVADNTIVPSSNGGIFKKTSSGWKVTPTTNDSIMKIRVSGILNNQTKIFDGGEFRVKNPPDGIGSIDVNGNYSTDGKDLTKLFINNGIITGTKPKDFDYKYEIVVTSFDVKVGRLPVQNVNGNRVNRNAAAVDDVESQPSGTPIRFQNIKAKTIDGNVVNDGYIIMPFTIFIR